MIKVLIKSVQEVNSNLQRSPNFLDEQVLSFLTLAVVFVAAMQQFYFQSYLNFWPWKPNLWSPLCYFSMQFEHQRGRGWMSEYYFPKHSVDFRNEKVHYSDSILVEDKEIEVKEFNG